MISKENRRNRIHKEKICVNHVNVCTASTSRSSFQCVSSRISLKRFNELSCQSKAFRAFQIRWSHQEVHEFQTKRCRHILNFTISESDYLRRVFTLHSNRKRWVLENALNYCPVPCDVHLTSGTLIRSLRLLYDRLISMLRRLYFASLRFALLCFALLCFALLCFAFILLYFALPCLAWPCLAFLCFPLLSFAFPLPYLCLTCTFTIYLLLSTFYLFFLVYRFFFFWPFDLLTFTSFTSFTSFTFTFTVTLPRCTLLSLLLGTFNCIFTFHCLRVTFYILLHVTSLYSLLYFTLLYFTLYFFHFTLLYSLRYFPLRYFTLLYDVGSSSNLGCPPAASDRYNTLVVRLLSWNAARISSICITQKSCCALRFTLTIVVVVIYDVSRTYFVSESIFQSCLTQFCLCYVRLTRRHGDILILMTSKSRTLKRSETRLRKRNSVKAMCIRWRVEPRHFFSYGSRVMFAR